MLDTGRTNQKRRTRAALVKAALDLLRAGQSPTVSEVAHAALVSPATAYRYFPSARALWTAVLNELGGPSSEEVFANVPADDAEARVVAMIRAIGFRMFDDEALWRTAARLLHDRVPSAAGDADPARIPVPTGKRLRWIEDALAPLHRQLPGAVERKLTMSLALVIGAETVLALRDVCGLSADEAKDVILWSGRALVRAAQQEARGRATRNTGRPGAGKNARPGASTRATKR